MESKQIDKNILEARYQKELQEYNAILIALSVGMLAFFGTFIWSFEKLRLGLTIIAIALLLLFGWFQKTRRNMKELLEDMENLKSGK